MECVLSSGLGMHIFGVSLMTTPFTPHCIGHIKWFSILATIDCLVENQDVNLASSEVVICDGT